MEEEKRKKTTAEKIAELKKRIVGCKDPKLAEQLLNQLLGLHKSTFEMNRLLDIPLSEIKDEIDLGANKIYRTIRGYAWECKGGMITFVEHRMSRVCAMLNTIFELHNKEDKTEDEQSLYDSFSTAVAYIFQAPIFSSLDEKALFQNATSILSTFQEYANKHYTNAEAVDETEEDIKENIQEEQMANALETLANTPLPPEDKDE